MDLADTQEYFELQHEPCTSVNSTQAHSSYNTRREGDIEFTTDLNFFEEIFNALTIVGTLEIAPWIYHEN